MPVNYIYIGADHNVQYDGAADEVTEVSLNTGTCSWTLQDSSGNTLATGTCPYIAASSGNYHGVIDGPTVTANLVVGLDYIVNIIFNQGDYDDFRSLKYRAAYRGRV